MMQYPQPMHQVRSTSTTPSGAWYVAPTGHTWTQGGFSHWLQSLGTKNAFSMSSFLMSLSPSSFEVDLRGREAVACALRVIGIHFPFFGQHVPLHPGPGNVGVIGNFVFQLAGLDAETAAHAFVRVNQEHPADRCGCPPPPGQTVFWGQ